MTRHFALRKKQEILGLKPRLGLGICAWQFKAKGLNNG